MTTPAWSEEIRTLYLSGAASQFILSGNVNDRLFWVCDGGDGGDSRGAGEERLGSLLEFLCGEQLRRFDVILTYDLGAGLQVAPQGEAVFSKWPSARSGSALPAKPQEAIPYIDHYLRYCCNLSRAQREGDEDPEREAGGPRHIRVAVIIRAAHLVFPAIRGGLSYELNALASIARSWAAETHFLGHPLATFLITDNLNDLHSLIVNNPRVGIIGVPIPCAARLEPVLEHFAKVYPRALAEFRNGMREPAMQLAGATLSSVESLLKTKEYRKEAISHEDLSDLKKDLVEKDCQGLIEFIESQRTLEDVQGHDAVVEWMRQDIALWRQNDLRAMPMGYLLCGPVGTGKTFMVECLAGEAGVPVVKLKNFRDRWVGSTEGNLETIFRLLEALGRCIVFIDEADQALGSRVVGSGDSGVSGRVYSMIAKEMSDTSNRGRILWILASSRPDMIEVDLKRPGRIDVKIPLFPTSTPAEGYALIRALCRKQEIELAEEPAEDVLAMVPEWVTPGAAEALAIKVYRLARTTGCGPEEALRRSLCGYQNPVAREVLEFQIGLATREASDMVFIPNAYRN